MATTYTISAKNTEYAGEVAGVAFSRGVGEAVDLAPNVLAYFERHGYEVARKGGRKPAAAKSESPPKTDGSSGDGKDE